MANKTNLVQFFVVKTTQETKSYYQFYDYKLGARFGTARQKKLAAKFSAPAADFLIKQLLILDKELIGRLSVERII